MDLEPYVKIQMNHEISKTMVHIVQKFYNVHYANLTDHIIKLDKKIYSLQSLFV